MHWQSYFDNLRYHILQQISASTKIKKTFYSIEKENNYCGTHTPVISHVRNFKTSCPIDIYFDHLVNVSTIYIIYRFLSKNSVISCLS